jgi:hypothetical protein
LEFWVITGDSRDKGNTPTEWSGTSGERIRGEALSGLAMLGEVAKPGHGQELRDQSNHPFKP